MSETQLEAVYVDLDVLLDTRLGTLARIDPEAPTRVLAAGYHTRDTDIFDGVDPELFTKMYAKRDVETLACSIFTGSFLFLRHLMMELSEQALVRPYHSGGKLIVNLHPYVLEEELQDELGKAIAARLGAIVPVELINVPREQLTPLHCKTNYAAMMMYEYATWLDMHTEAFEETRLPAVPLFVPQLYFNAKPTEQELEEMIKESMHPWQAIVFMTSPVISLQLIDIKAFSIIGPDGR